MIELEVSVQLLIGLASAVFGFVVATTGRVSSAGAAIAAVGAAPLLLWVILPDFLNAADITLPFEVRRPAVLLVGVAILLRYLPYRTARLGRRGERIAVIAAAVLFLTGVGLTTANWIVAVGAVLPTVASVGGYVSTSEASADEAPEPHPRLPDNPQ